MDVDARAPYRLLTVNNCNLVDGLSAMILDQQED
jgi:hypothetical protein